MRAWEPLRLVRQQLVQSCGVFVGVVFWRLSLGIERLMVLVWWQGFLKGSRWGVKLGQPLQVAKQPSTFQVLQWERNVPEISDNQQFGWSLGSPY